MRERAPPPVQVELGHGRTGRVLVSLSWALAAAAVVAWSALPWAWLVPPVVAALAWHCARPQRGLLIWDGSAWRWRCEGAEQPGAAQIMLDLGDALVLRFLPAAPGRAAWWWLGRREAGGVWHALRVALVQQRPSAAPSA